MRGRGRCVQFLHQIFVVSQRDLLAALGLLGWWTSGRELGLNTQGSARA